MEYTFYALKREDRIFLKLSQATWQNGIFKK